MRVFRLTKARRQPQIIGTDMHILMGEEELSDVTWDEKTGILRVTEPGLFASKT